MIQQDKNDKDYYEITGYANVVGRESRPIRDIVTGERFTEVMAPGCFERALKRGKYDIWADVNHDDENKQVGLMSAHNMDLYEDSIGLYAKVKANKKRFDQISDINALEGWSIRFAAYPDTIEFETSSAGMRRRIIHDLDLKSISIIDHNNKDRPTYKGTSIEVRSDGCMVEWLRPGNVSGQLKVKKVFFTDDDMKKIRPESTPLIETNSSYEAQKVVNLRRTLILEIFNSIKRRKQNG